MIVRPIPRRWGKSKVFRPVFGPVLLKSIWQFWRLQMRVSKLSRAPKRLESQGDQLQWMSEDNNSKSNSIQRNKIPSYKSNQEGQRLIHWKITKHYQTTGSHEMGQLIPWTHPELQGHDLCFRPWGDPWKDIPRQGTGCRGWKRILGETEASSCSLWACTSNSPWESGLFFHQASQSLCLGASHCLDPFLPWLSPTSPCRPRWQTERVLAKCWECSTGWACSWWHGNSPRWVTHQLTLWSLCTLIYVCSVSI